MFNEQKAAALADPASANLAKSELSGDTVELMNDLIETNRGLIQVFETAADRLQDEANTRLLNFYIDQHKSYIRALSNIMTSEGNKPDMSRASTRTRLIKQAWVTLKAAITDGDGPILSELAQNAETALEAYVEAMAANLPDATRDIVRKQMSEIRIAHKKLSALSAAYNQ